MKLPTLVLAACLVAGGLVAVAAPATAMMQWCTSATGNCQGYVVCLGVTYQNGHVQRCDHGVPDNVIPGCDPASCDAILP
ncbi:MAG: hypothetical protein QOE90_2010 [Thermoplasmata archaeon]|jgi:hypothetical protein|nr:hypothetical protein [Thermoplasmata archaeon]